jgi:cation transporter-like permease
MRAPKILQGLSRGMVVLLLVLLALLGAAIAFAVSVWTSEQAELPPYIWAALAGGVFFSLVVGIGLMALVFYSARSGYDEAPRLEEPDDRHQEAHQDLHQAAPRAGR